jgi:Tol biopolymer transport system component
VGAIANYGDVELSPNDDRVAVDMITNNNRDIWVIDIARAVTSRITFDPGTDWTPVWAPDGSKIFFASTRNETTHMYQKSSSGVGTEEVVANTDRNEIPVHLSPDGQRVVYSRRRPETNIQAWDTWLFDLSAGRKEKRASPFIESPFDKLHARVSPNGRSIAYATNDSGMYQIVVQSFPDPNGGKWQITAQGGVEPKWRHDGRELYYLAFDGKLMSVAVKPDRTFGTPVALFDTPLTVNRNQPSRDRRYDVAADGRFLLAIPVGTTAAAPVTAVLNWTSGLEQK